MALRQVELPTPDEMGARWAAYAAVMVCLGFGEAAFAADGRWHFDDSGGNWADLVRMGDRAVMFGNDHEYSQTYFREAAEYFQEEETDLLAEAPDWWSSALPTDPNNWVGFIYGFDGKIWQRAEYDRDDGFESLGHPAVDHERFAGQVREFVVGAAEDAGFEFTPSDEAINDLAAAGHLLTEAQLGAVLGPGQYNLGAGVAAARKFSP
jgi:hypothetical protein